jgi:serine/threonine protein kinase
MALTLGTQLGSHEIVALLGKGGMGEVYRARDLKLKREVAIKILPHEFAEDSDRVSRFQREAEVLASLNHPNIAGIHDLQEANGSRYLVLELVEGETLADQLNRGPLSLDQVVAISKQIVDALEAAHERGIVHRDLKPGNIKRTPEGTVKVLDFGLAKTAQWFDRKGKPAGDVSTPGNVGSIRLFQDGRIALDNGGLGPDRDRDIWVVDGRGVPIKVTSDNPNFDAYPVWSPDGMRLVFGSSREKGSIGVKLYQKSSNGLGAAEPLFSSDPDAIDFPLDWTTNNIVFQRLKTASLTSEIWLLSMPEKKTSAYVNNGFNNVQARVSPDGRYLAYATSESGSASLQIVVQTFPDPKINRWQITAQGGSEPLWRSDGGELYYLAPDGKLMAVAVKSGPTFEAGQTSELFQTSLKPAGVENNPFANRYAVSKDGQRFLIAAGSSTPATNGDSIPITALVNWTATLRKK